MTDKMNSDEDTERALNRFSEKSGHDRDPLQKYESIFIEVDEDPFELFIAKKIRPKNPDEDTLRKYRTTFEQWQSFMAEQGRHPACPQVRHVTAFADHLRTPKADGGYGNQGSTITRKINRLEQAYRYWRKEPSLPQPHHHQNPFDTASDEINFEDPSKEVRRIPLDQLRRVLDSVTHFRSLAILVFQLKLGLRVGELCNIRLEDVSLTGPDVQDHYAELGTHPELDGHENAIYIPARDERQGNKSALSRLLPLDDELRRVLLGYLLVRPDVDNPWVFLSKKSHSKIGQSKPVNDIWRDAFEPKYEETDRYQPIRSHYGRHWFTTYWRVQVGLNEELVQYMRGDSDRFGSSDSRRSMDTYLHPSYEDIEDTYREQIYRLKVTPHGI